MPKPNKIIVISCIAYILLMVLIDLLMHILPMTYANGHVETAFGYLLYLGVPIAIMLTLTGVIKKGEPSGVIIRKVFTTMIIACIPAAYAFANALDLCAWPTGKVLFVNIHNNQKIVVREFGCGAVDSTEPDEEVSKITPVTPLFILITKADTTAIDRKVWKTVSDE